MATVLEDRMLQRRWAATPRLVRFFAVGGLNTAFGYGAYAALLFVGFHYAWAALLGTIAGVIFNYFTTGRLVFGDATGRSLVRFLAVYGVLYVLNVAGLALLQKTGMGPYVAGLVLIVPMALVSFALMKRFVFRSAGVPH